MRGLRNKRCMRVAVTFRLELHRYRVRLHQGQQRQRSERDNQSGREALAALEPSQSSHPDLQKRPGAPLTSGGPIRRGTGIEVLRYLAELEFNHQYEPRFGARVPDTRGVHRTTDTRGGVPSNLLEQTNPSTCRFATELV
jgi:hypothetical protein